MDLSIETLQARLGEALPGREAQFNMAHAQRVELLGRHYVVPEGVKIASVLVLLHRLAAEPDWRVVLIERTTNPLDRHSGQVSFPGGRVEPDDASLEAAATREAYEEVGIAPDMVQVIGRLTELYIPVSNFLVHPFVAVLEQPPVFVPQPGEVETILSPKISTFLQEDARRIKDLDLGPGVRLRDVPYFEVEGRTVWGATAMILSELGSLITRSPR